MLYMEKKRLEQGNSIIAKFDLLSVSWFDIIHGFFSFRFFTMSRKLEQVQRMTALEICARI